VGCRHGSRDWGRPRHPWCVRRWTHTNPLPGRAYVEGRTWRQSSSTLGVTFRVATTWRLLPVPTTSGEQVHKHLPFPRDHKHSTGPSHVVRGGRGAVSFTRWPTNHYSQKQTTLDFIRHWGEKDTGLNLKKYGELKFGDTNREILNNVARQHCTNIMYWHYYTKFQLQIVMFFPLEMLCYEHWLCHEHFKVCCVHQLMGYHEMKMILLNNATSIR